MYALGLSLILFVFFCLVGKFVLGALLPRLGVLKSWLLAPSIGLSATLLGVMLGNQAGVPIRSFAWIWLLILSAGSGFWLFRNRKNCFGGLNRALPFGALFAVFLGLAGWPALLFGFNWVSYVNDDMANYCLAAERFMDSGFFDVPSAVAINLRDLAQNFWYMHASDLMRFGSEHLLAWVGALTGARAHSIFMPVILALGGVQLFAVGALVLHKGRYRAWALTATALLALSPLFMLGALYQLIAQVGGLALLMAVLTLLLKEEPPSPPRVGSIVREALAAALPAAILCIYYPEVTPFAVLTAGFYAAVVAVRSRSLPWVLVRRGLYALAAILVILNHNIISYLCTLANQAGVVASKVDLSLSLFPFFLLPSGAANLLGLMPISRNYAEPYLSISIAVGLAGTAVALVIFFWGSKRAYPIAILGLVQAFLAYRLFSSGNDFGLFKLAMFVQPALAAAGALAITRISSRGWIAAVLVAAYGCATFGSGRFYAVSSCGFTAGGITELRLASKLGVSIEPTFPKPSKIVSTIDNVVAAKLAAGELRGYDLAFASRDFFFPAVRFSWKSPDYVMRHHPFAKNMMHTWELIESHTGVYTKTAMIWKTTFTYPTNVEGAEYYLAMAPQFSLFNKFDTDPEAPVDKLFRFIPAGEVHNMLVFVHSIRGNHYYLGDRRRIAIFQQEQDPYQPDSNFTGIGRFILMRVANPSEELYLRVSATRTFVMQRSEWSDKASIHGEKEYPMGLSGAGAFNQIVGPLRPYFVDGSAYIAIDLHEFPQPMLDKRSGLMGLYSKQVPRDFRRLTGWGRDISALSPEEYAGLERPRSVSRFPEDFTRARGLEFKGVFEDGWLGPRSAWTIAKAEEGEWLSLSGSVPDIPGSSLDSGTLSIRINGVPVGKLATKAGPFRFEHPIPHTGKPTRVELDFDKAAALPEGDGRIVGAKLKTLAILGTAEAAGAFGPARDLGMKTQGIDEDGWAERQSWLATKASDTPSTLVLECELPAGPDGEGALLETFSGADSIQRFPLKPGLTTVKIPLEAKATATLKLVCSRDFRLAPPDERQRSFRILSIKLETHP